MSLPHKADPQRWLFCAVWLMRLLGAALSIYAAYSIQPALRFAFTDGSPSTELPINLGRPALYLVPGGILLALSFFVARRQFWSVVAALFIASVACAILTVAMMVLAFFLGAVDIPRVAYWIVALLATIDFVFAILILLLMQSFAMIRTVPADGRAFEPGMTETKTAIAPPGDPNAESNGT